MRVLILLALATSLVADGGGVVMQKAMNGLRVTVVANPLPMSTGQEQIAVLVERTFMPVQDARVAIRARSPEGQVQEVEATRSEMDGWFTLRQQLTAAGNWEFQVFVDSAGVRADIPVMVQVQSRAAVDQFIPLIAIAPVGAILLLLNRALRGRSSGSVQNPLVSACSKR